MAMYLRLLAVQGSWNYETLNGTGIGFAMEPALRYLPGGIDGPAYRAALARESRYFNTHPYLAGVAVGALVRAELDGVDPVRIERFRTALAGPLGSVGDRLVWASWLPFCSLIALCVYGAGGSPLGVVGTFLLLYNVGHLSLRAWGLQIGLSRGLNVASALGNPVLRKGRRHHRLGVDRNSHPCASARARGGLAHCPRGARGFRSLLGPDLMPEREVKIVNKLGIHARPAAEIVKTAGKFKSSITIVRDDLEVNAKSIMGVMMLAAEFGSMIVLRAIGDDAEAALDALATCIANKFGES
jgi:PTS system mannose-specific IID component